MALSKLPKPSATALPRSSRERILAAASILFQVLDRSEARLAVSAPTSPSRLPSLKGLLRGETSRRGQAAWSGLELGLELGFGLGWSWGGGWGLGLELGFGVWGLGLGLGWG